jgi:HEAT repeat protein
MTATEVVRLVLIIEVIALAGILLAIFGFGAWSQAAEASRGRRLSAARAIIAGRFDSRQIPPGDMAFLRGLPFGDQRRLLFEIATSVGQSEREWLRAIARELGVLDSTIAKTRADQWWTRLWAARFLTLLDADPRVMHPLFHDENPMVRASAATYVAQHPTDEGIDALIAMLADPAMRCRLFAKDALMRLGSAATPTLLTRLANPDDTQTVSMLEVAAAIATPEYLSTAVLHTADPRPAVRLLAARLLRGVSGPEAADHLTRLLADTDATVRIAAAEGIAFLNHWTASPAVLRLLDDDDSRVRIAGAASLAQLGPAGELLLRRSRSKGSERAALAASRVLDDPSRVESAAS